MARRRRRRRPGGHTTAVGSGGRRASFSTDTASHTHTARSLDCPLLTLSSARPFSNGIFRSHGAPASLPPASSSLTHARRMDGFCNQNADQLVPRRAVPSDCICRCSRMRVRLPLHILHTGFPMSAHLSRLRLFQRHLRSLLWVWVWVWDWVHTPPHTLATLLSSTQYPSPSRSLARDGQTSPHKSRLVVPHSIPEHDSYLITLEGFDWCVECLVGKKNKPTLFKVTEPSSVPYRTPSACAKRVTVVRARVCMYKWALAT